MARWSKGVSGNPGGRPKRGEAIAELARDQIHKHDLIAKLGEIAAGKNADVPDQIRAIQLLLAYGYGPPKTEVNTHEGIVIQVVYAQTNHIVHPGAARGAVEGHPGSEAVQRRLLRSAMGQDAIGDQPPDSGRTPR